MGKKEIKETDNFIVEGENGMQYTIIEYQEILIIESFNQPSQKKEGLKFYRTNDGLCVNKKNNTTFEILTPDPRIPDGSIITHLTD